MDSTKHTHKITPEFDEIIYIRRNFPSEGTAIDDNHETKNDEEPDEEEKEILRRKRVKNIEKQHRYKVIITFKTRPIEGCYSIKKFVP